MYNIISSAINITTVTHPTVTVIFRTESDQLKLTIMMADAREIDSRIQSMVGLGNVYAHIAIMDVLMNPLIMSEIAHPVQRREALIIPITIPSRINRHNRSRVDSGPPKRMLSALLISMLLEWSY